MNMHITADHAANYDEDEDTETRAARVDFIKRLVRACGSIRIVADAANINPDALRRVCANDWRGAIGPIGRSIEVALEMDFNEVESDAELQLVIDAAAARVLELSALQVTHTPRAGVSPSAGLSRTPIVSFAAERVVYDIAGEILVRTDAATTRRQRRFLRDLNLTYVTMAQLTGVRMPVLASSISGRPGGDVPLVWGRISKLLGALTPSFQDPKDDGPKIVAAARAQLVTAHANHVQTIRRTNVRLATERVTYLLSRPLLAIAHHQIYDNLRDWSAPSAAFCRHIEAKLNLPVGLLDDSEAFGLRSDDSHRLIRAAIERAVPENEDAVLLDLYGPAPVPEPEQEPEPQMPPEPIKPRRTRRP